MSSKTDSMIEPEGVKKDDRNSFQIPMDEYRSSKNAPIVDTQATIISHR